MVCNVVGLLYIFYICSLGFESRPLHQLRTYFRNLVDCCAPANHQLKYSTRFCVAPCFALCGCQFHVCRLAYNFVTGDYRRLCFGHGAQNMFWARTVPKSCFEHGAQIMFWARVLFLFGKSSKTLRRRVRCCDFLQKLGNFWLVRWCPSMSYGVPSCRTRLLWRACPHWRTKASWTNFGALAQSFVISW